MTAIEVTDVNVARELMGDKLPSKGPLPAAWWLTTDPGQLDAFDRWAKDYAAHVERIGELAATIGLTAEDAYISSFGRRTDLVGFRVPVAMTYWQGHPDAQPVPEGWRIHRQTATPKLVPARKTKALREGPVCRAFAAVERFPNVRAYLSGIPTDLYLEDRGWGGGTMYAVNYRRGEACVWAYCGGDPDRQTEEQTRRKGFEVDETVWSRMPLSVLAKLMEEKAERLAAAEASA